MGAELAPVPWICDAVGIGTFECTFCIKIWLDPFRHRFPSGRSWHPIFSISIYFLIPADKVPVPFDGGTVRDFPDWKRIIPGFKSIWVAGKGSDRAVWWCTATWFGTAG